MITMFEDIKQENIKLTVVENEKENNDSCFEVAISRDFLNSLLISILTIKDTYSNEIFKLTQREIEVLGYMSEGKNNSEIADIMIVSPHTAKIHVSNILRKLGVKDRTEAVVKAIKYNLIDIFS